MKKLLSFMLATALIICSCISILPFVHTAHADTAEQKIYATSLNDTSYARGGELAGTETQRIDYAYKVEDTYFNPNKLPDYLSEYTCGIHAGGNIIGHYDVFYEELIPNHTIRNFLGKWLYGTQGAEVNAMFDSLYTRMGADSEGVTINGYKNGLTSYTSSKGRTMVHTKSMASAGKLNSSQYKAALQNGKLMSIFIDGFTILTLGDFLTYSNYDTVNIYKYTGAHVMAVYGYRDVYYYNAQGQCFRTDNYLYVETGFTLGLGYLKLNNQSGQIDDAYINEIY